MGPLVAQLRAEALVEALRDLGKEAQAPDPYRISQALAALVDRCKSNTGKVRCQLIAALETERAVVARWRRDG